MSEEYADRPVKITSTPRSHPAIRAIARACIALARWQRDQEALEPGKPTAETTPPRPPAAKPSEEASHD
jgi:hypothetical protein